MRKTIEFHALVIALMAFVTLALESNKEYPQRTICSNTVLAVFYVEE